MAIRYCPLLPAVTFERRRPNIPTAASPSTPRHSHMPVTPRYHVCRCNDAKREAWPMVFQPFVVRQTDFYIPRACTKESTCLPLSRTRANPSVRPDATSNIQSSRSLDGPARDTPTGPAVDGGWSMKFRLRRQRRRSQANTGPPRVGT